MVEKSGEILVVEDEEKLSQLLLEYLEASGYNVTIMAEGSGVVEEVRRNRPDLILLDIMLPGKDGVEICKEVRSFSTVPIIMATARVEEIDRLLGLELGADDYICKPYSPREVVARVKAVLRRDSYSKLGEPQAHPKGLRLDEDRYQAFLFGKLLDLTPVEFRLLVILARAPGKVYSRDQLMGHIYNDQRVVTDRTVDTHVKNLRKKMQSHLEGEELIQSVYGVGYRLAMD